MKYKQMALIGAILAGATAMVAGACGVITSPISVPMAIAENTFFVISGSIIDLNGKPIDGVTCEQNLNHRLWEPALGTTTNNYRNRVRKFNGNYDATERGHELDLIFSHDDFKVSKITLKNESKVISTPLGDWPESGKFPVVMYPRSYNDAVLNHTGRDLQFADQKTLPAIDIQSGALTEKSRSVDENIPAGTFYITLTKQDPAPSNTKGDIDPLEINLPAEIVLRIGKAEIGEFGFVTHAPRLGFAPMQTMDEAPASGYKPELTISRARLKEMRKANERNLVTAYEYFYFKSNDIYGKGCIRWSNPQQRNAPPMFHVELHAQKKTGDRDLTSRDASTPFSN